MTLFFEILQSHLLFSCILIFRYRKFLLWLGVPQHRLNESRPNEFCRIVSEFALEYRTTRERVCQQIEKQNINKERNKTRVVNNKFVPDIEKIKTSSLQVNDNEKDAELR
jgi:hypothetical protein